MDTVWILLRQIGIMFAFMAIGWIMTKGKWLTNQGTKDLSNLLLRVVVPIIIIKSFITENTSEKITGLFISFGLALLAITIAVVISGLVFSKRSVVNQFGTAFSNAGFFGIPIVSALYGDEAVFYIASFIMFIFFFQWTYGVFLFTRDKTIFQPKKLFMNPVVVAFLLGMILFFTQLPIPDVVTSAMGMITPLNTPIAMIILGSYMAKDKLVKIFTNSQAYLVSVFRLLVIPLVTIAIFTLLPAEVSVIRTAVLISAIAPVGVNVAVFAGLYDQDYNQSVRIVCLSTILCVATIPLLVMLTEWIW